MSVESMLEATISLDDTDIPCHLHMRTLHLARLLDELDSLDDVKYVVLVEMLNLDREINALRHDVVTLSNTLKELIG